MKRKLTCIICPRGCSITAEGDANNIKVTGNACKRGEKYAVNECIHPCRTVTSTVRVINRTDTMLSVKTEKPIPKEKIFEIMKIIRVTEVTAPVNIGDAVIDDIFDTRVIATKNIS